MVTLIIQHRRWKWEAKLEYLRTERRRMEVLYREILEQLGKAMAAGSYPSSMLADIMVMMPQGIADPFNVWMADTDKDGTKARHAYLDISVAMKQSLADVDKRIAELIQ
ncbi:MAG: hypothetical protein M3Z35_06685 [Nitrospirota bacterium]|nr:hypothetical protein [Nitrospirota bacterium]